MTQRVVLLTAALAACSGSLRDSDTDTAPPSLEVEASVHEVMGSIVVLDWTQEDPGSVRAEYSVDEGEWMTTPTWEVEAGPRQLLLLGAPFGAEVTWRLLVDEQAVTEDETIQTEAPPAGLPIADRADGDPAAWDADTRWLLGSLTPGQGSPYGTRTWSFIVDRQGRPVWANETPASRTSFAPHPSVDGTEILVDYNSWWGAFDGGANSQVARLDIEGTTVGTWDTPGLIHPFIQTGDGSIAWTAAQGGMAYSGEVLAILEPSGEPRTLFDCNAFSHALGGGNCGANTVFWNPADGHYLISIYTLDTVIEVDADGEPVRWFGHLPGAWEFAAADATFWWQHGTQYLENGHLLVSTRRDEITEETVVREYTLDEGAEQLVEVWSFGEGEGVYAPILGEARRLPGGNTLHNYGSNPRVREATPAGDVVWDVAWDEGGTLGCTEVVHDLYAMWGGTP